MEGISGNALVHVPVGIGLKTYELKKLIDCKGADFPCLSLTRDGIVPTVGNVIFGASNTQTCIVEFHHRTNGTWTTKTIEVQPEHGILCEGGKMVMAKHLDQWQWLFSTKGMQLQKRPLAVVSRVMLKEKLSTQLYSVEIAKASNLVVNGLILESRRL